MSEVQVGDRVRILKSENAAKVGDIVTVSSAGDDYVCYAGVYNGLEREVWYANSLNYEILPRETLPDSELPDTFANHVDSILNNLGDMLKSKNAAYGNSALDPVRVFSKADSSEQIRVRLDDKLSRLARGSAAGEDVVHDLLGYLVLLLIAEGEK